MKSLFGIIFMLMTIVLDDFLLDQLWVEKNLKNILINPTGLIKTDLLILDIFGKSIIGKISKNKWENILKNHNVPEKFFKIKKYF